MTPYQWWIHLGFYYSSLKAPNQLRAMKSYVLCQVGCPFCLVLVLTLKELWLHTSNSSQNPCLGFSELSATLLSSRTRFSMLAAFILVALKGCCQHIQTRTFDLSTGQRYISFGISHAWYCTNIHTCIWSISFDANDCLRHSTLIWPWCCAIICAYLNASDKDGILQGHHCHQCGDGFMLYCSVKALWVVRLTGKMLHKCSPFTIPYLFEVHYDATFLHHGVFLIVIHQVSQGVEPLTTANIIFTILLKMWSWQFNTAATTWGVIKSPEIQCRGHSLRHSSRLFSFTEFKTSV